MHCGHKTYNYVCITYSIRGLLQTICKTSHHRTDNIHGWSKSLLEPMAHQLFVKCISVCVHCSTPSSLHPASEINLNNSCKQSALIESPSNINPHYMCTRMD